ncbi:ABC transporter substrate-binding protein [Aestuariicella hydrocarbonica]|uniref:ABC transporter substrate-binding protein n=1 Tax=Pseudomaricurvus hydrocarbonicus TaxID=1470433 RepID=A0A9E5MN67_9GAMM|nr:TRAP transporter substrate-binding protein DctP [Aestuariicella hydrocarbonica]NHO67326.1 ABC transporter substrate-binding protein [Aestuariicella hydrocarbonica]
MNEYNKPIFKIGIARKAFLGAIIGAAVMAAGVVAQVNSPSPRVLTFSDHQPSDRMRTRFLKDVLFPAIERESSGRLKIDAHWNGEIAAAYDALNAVSNGVTDMATTVPEYTAKELPLHQIFKSFPVGPTANSQINFFHRVYNEIPAFTAELKQNNIVPIFFGTGYPVAFYSASPLDHLDGIAGAKWRSASFWHLDFLKNVGATPVTMHWGPEIYEAMKAKTLDGLMVNVDSGYFLNVHDVAPNILVSKALWLGHIYPLTMNDDVWDSLTQEDKDAIHRAVEISSQSLGAVMDDSFEAQIDALRRAGAKVRILNSDEIEHLKEATKYEEVQAKWVETQESNGNPNAGNVLVKVKSIMSEIMN